MGIEPGVLLKANAVLVQHEHRRRGLTPLVDKAPWMEVQDGRGTSMYICGSPRLGLTMAAKTCQSCMRGHASLGGTVKSLKKVQIHLVVEPSRGSHCNDHGIIAIMTEQ